MVQPQVESLKLHEAEKLQRAGNLSRAQALCDEILTAHPKHSGALNLSGVLAAMTGNHQKALVLFDKAVASDPDTASPYNNRGITLHMLQRFDAALQSFQKALLLRPGYAEALFNRANLLKELGRLEEAVASYDQAIDNRPDYAEAYCNRGVALKDLHRLGDAIASFDHAIASQPGNANAECNRAYTALLRGDFATGLRGYEWRWSLPQNSTRDVGREGARPLWLGEESLRGRTLLLYSEQGFGDTLQFCRYATLAAERGASVLLEVQAPLVSLLRNLVGPSLVTDRHGALPDFDLRCPLLSLPLAFKTTLDTIPARKSYLCSSAAKQAEWRARLGQQRLPSLGLVWSGSETNLNGRNRSIPLAQLSSMLPTGWRLFGLQKEVRASDRKALKELRQLQNLGTELHDFSDTAAVCECMDVVVTVDTAVAHLSASLGKETWVLLPFNPDWRWLLGRSDTPWYPTARLYRQERPGDWTPVLARVRQDLERRAAHS